MEVSRINWENAAEARGIAVVIDVIRAFSVASYGFAGGAKRFWLAGSADEARVLREREPEALLAGEIKGRLIPGFQLNNSPARMAASDVRGRLIIQSTGAGTRGAVAASNARHLLIAAFTNAGATANHAHHLAETQQLPISIFPTATFPDGQRIVPNEDELCAGYLEALLRKQDDAPVILRSALEKMRATPEHYFDPISSTDSDFPPGDIDACLDANCFRFAMLGARKTWQDITYIEIERVELPS